jgi:hypothetical protein
MYVLYKIKKRIFTSKLFGCIKTFKTKKFWKFSFFFWTVYRVRAGMVGGNFSPIGEYSSTVKNRQKWASVHRRVGLKGKHFNILRQSYSLINLTNILLLESTFNGALNVYRGTLRCSNCPDFYIPTIYNLYIICIWRYEKIDFFLVNKSIK